MKMTREQMDAIINAHFMFEATDDIEGVIGSLAAEVRHEVVPSPMGAQTDKAHIRTFYEMLFADLKGDKVTPVQRLYGEDFVVDEAVWHGEITNGRPFLMDGRSGRASFRLLHIFRFSEGKIASEQVWCDLAAIQRQLGAQPSKGEHSSPQSIVKCGNASPIDEGVVWA
jgi:ketosteroid isomerase-like protein